MHQLCHDAIRCERIAAPNGGIGDDQRRETAPGRGRKDQPVLSVPVLRLILLAPVIVETILDGRQPATLQMDTPPEALSQRVDGTTEAHFRSVITFSKPFALALPGNVWHPLPSIP